MRKNMPTLKCCRGLDTRKFSSAKICTFTVMLFSDCMGKETKIKPLYNAPFRLQGKGKQNIKTSFILHGKGNQRETCV